MIIAIIGRSELMYNVAKLVIEQGHKISLIITAKASPEYIIKEHDFEVLANSLNAKYICTSKINESIIMSSIDSCGPIDIALSVNYSGIISSAIINKFRLGILNAHGGDLPRYRGNACQAWAIINGEDKVGLCIHRMIGGELDSGDIIARDYFTLQQNSRVGEVYEWMAKQIPILMLEATEKLGYDPSFVLEVQSKDQSNSLRCYPRNPEDGRIDWSKDALEILRLINASSEPFSGAYAYFENVKIIVWRASLGNPIPPYLAENGQIMFTGEGEILISCGRGQIQLDEIEINGYRTANIREILKTIRKRLK
jgi:methionyl-tRNA formyltransferase